MIHDDEVIQDTEDSEPNSEHESTDASIEMLQNIKICCSVGRHYKQLDIGSM